MSTRNPTKTISAITQAVVRWQDATQDFDEAVGERLSLNAAERRCLGALMTANLPAGEIARATGLTPAAVTALVDRLEKRGYVERRRDDADRRKVVVVPTEEAQRILLGYYGPIADDGAAMLGQFSNDELDIILRFIEEAQSLQQRHTNRVLSGPAARPGDPGKT